MSRSRYTLLINSLIHWFINSLIHWLKKIQNVSRTCASGVSYYISSSCFHNFHSCTPGMHLFFTHFTLVGDRNQRKWKMFLIKNKIQLKSETVKIIQPSVKKQVFTQTFRFFLVDSKGSGLGLRNCLWGG